jgi:hypothetical protein
MYIKTFCWIWLSSSRFFLSQAYDVCSFWRMSVKNEWAWGRNDVVNILKHFFRGGAVCCWRAWAFWDVCWAIFWQFCLELCVLHFSVTYSHSYLEILKTYFQLMFIKYENRSVDSWTMDMKMTILLCLFIWDKFEPHFFQSEPHFSSEGPWYFSTCSPF